MFLCVNLPFIVCDLVFASSSDGCVNQVGTNIELTLGTWLQVDGYCRVGFLVLLLLIPIIRYCWDYESGRNLINYAICCFLIYSIFNLAWLIVGSILFWGDLFQRESCQGTQTEEYMFAVLIIGYIFVGILIFVICFLLFAIYLIFVI